MSVIVLAAGSSSRLGQPKQLVQFRGKTLLQHTLDVLDRISLGMKVLVLGAHSKQIREATNVKDFVVLENLDWQHGISSSIRKGVEKVTENERIKHLLILLADQPFISYQLILTLATSRHAHRISACQYRGTAGVPAIFPAKYFHELMSLKGDQGAKKIFKKTKSEIILVDFESGQFDVDTPEDLGLLKKMK